MDTEELAVLHDELVRLIKDVEKDYAEVTKPRTKLKRIQREHKIEDMLETLASGKNTYSLYLSLLKQMAKEADRKTYTEFKEKGNHHHKALSDLVQNVKLAKQNLAKEPRGPGDKDRKDINTWGADEIIEEGKKVQDASNAALGRTQRLVDATEAIAIDTNIALHEQTDQMKQTNAEIEGVSQDLNRADKIVAHIARRLATDKMIMCLVLVLVLAILGLIVSKAMGVLPGDGGGGDTEVDCSLDLTQRNSDCIAAREAAAKENGGRRWRRAFDPAPFETQARQPIDLGGGSDPPERVPQIGGAGKVAEVANLGLD